VSLRTRAALAVLILPLTLAACGSDAGNDMADGVVDEMAESPAMTASGSVTIADVGFATPESVLHDPSADVYLVSNINGAPTDHDGNGFISRVSPTGEVLDLKWIDGEAEGVTLSAPKGMAISEGRLWVTDIDCVRMFDLATGAPTGEVCIDGAAFLNDLAPHPAGDGVLLTDSGLDATFAATGADALYHVGLDGYAPIIADAEFGAPNGVAITPDGGVLVVTFMSGRVFSVTGENERTEVLAVEGAQFDGIEVLADGRVLVSNWATSCVHLLEADGTLSCAMPDLDAPADIGFDAGRSHVLIPLFNANEVRIIPLG
jgi:sugar lactone lactonase YvrE